MTRWTPRPSDALTRAREIARERNHAQVGPLDLLFALLVPDDGILPALFSHLGKDLIQARAIVDTALDQIDRARQPVLEPPTSPAMRGALEIAETERGVLDDREAGEEHLLIALVSADGGLPLDTRKALDIKRGALLEAVRKIRSAEAVSGGVPTPGGTGAASPGGLTAVAQFCSDLTADAQLG